MISYKKTAASLSGLLLLGAASSASAITAVHDEAGEGNTNQPNTDVNGFVAGSPNYADSTIDTLTGQIGISIGTADQFNDEDIFKFTLEDGPFSANLTQTASLFAGPVPEMTLFEFSTANGEWLKRSGVIGAGVLLTHNADDSVVGFTGLFALLINSQGNAPTTFTGANIDGADALGTTWASMAGAGSGSFAYSIAVTGIDDAAVAAVPVPAAVWLFGSGLLGLVGVARRKA